MVTIIGGIDCALHYAAARRDTHSAQRVLAVRDTTIARSRQAAGGMRLRADADRDQTK